jgi:hypothetical protein
MDHDVYDVRRGAAFGIRFRIQVFTNGMLFVYCLNLCCGTTMFHMLELAPFYIPTPYFRPPTLIATLGASVQIRVPLCFRPFEHPAYVNVVKFESSFHDQVDMFGQPIN